MNDSPGWASPGSSPSDPSGSSQSPETEGRPQADGSPAPEQPAGRPHPNWAAQQPPSADSQGWGTAPGPGAPSGPGGGHGGPGGRGSGPGGWGSGWQQQPQAAKPGVVPLRPLNVFEILDGAVATMRAHWRTVLGISLAVAVVTRLVTTVASGLWMPDPADLDALSRNPNPSVDDILEATNLFSVPAVVTSAASAVVYQLGVVFVTAMLTVVVSRAVLGRPVSPGDAWQDARPRLLRMLGLLLLVPLLVGVVVTVGFVPGLLVLAAGAPEIGAALLVLGGLAGIVAGIWLYIRLSLSAPALMLEKQGVLAAMRRSAKLVRGSWWRIFGILLLTSILAVVLTGIVQLPATLIAMLVEGDAGQGVPSTGWTFLIISGVGEVIAYTLVFPVTAGITALLYLDQRIRREALDLELARAAGVPGYGPSSSGEEGGGQPGTGS